jgi:hypothetical protein
LSKIITIHSEVELEEAVKASFRNLKIPGLNLLPQETDASGGNADFWVRGDVDGRPLLFAVQCKRYPMARDLEQLKKTSGEAAPVLATVRLPKPLIERCRALGLSCFDLNGRLYLRQPGVIIDWNQGEKRFRLAEPERNLFAGKSSRIARALLSFPNRKWKQSDLAKFTECSGALISRLIREYIRLGWIEGSWADWNLIQPDALLDAWSAADSWKKRGTLRQYSALERDAEKLAGEFLKQSEGKIAFTQWFAAAHRHAYTELPIVSAYRMKFPEPEVVAALGLRETPTGGRLWVIVPREPGVFQATQTIDGFPLVCDTQIYLDLLQVGLRGPDASRALRQWEGFRG